jgi:hypothetical protein
MRKLITYLQWICIIATFTNAGLLIYISIFTYRDPLWYLAISGTIIQTSIFNYLLLISLFSYIISLILFFLHKKKYLMKFSLLIAPTIIWSLYFLYASLLIAGNYFGSSERLKRAWANNDSTYVRKYILSLNQESVEEMSAKTYRVLSEYTNFGYGMLFYTDEGWNKVSLTEKEYLKYNIYVVWKEYTNSKLFMNKNCKINFQEIIWSDKKFNDYEINKIQQTLNVIADSCEKESQR